MTETQTEPKATDTPRKHRRGRADTDLGQLRGAAFSRELKRYWQGRATLRNLKRLLGETARDTEPS